jgi:hypothetical protein
MGVLPHPGAPAATHRYLSSICEPPSYLTQARAGRDSHRRGQRTGALAAIRSALELPLPPGRSLDELRTEAIAALVLPDLEDTLAWDLPDEDSRAYGVAVDAKLERYATADRNGTVEVRRLADGLLLARLAGTGPPVNPTLNFSPSGACLVQRCGSDSRSRVWDLRGAEPALILEAPGRSSGTGRIEMTPAFDAEENHLALVHEDGAVKIHALDPARRNDEPRKVAEASRRYSSMAFRPGRPHLALGSYEKTVRFVDARDGSPVASLPHPDRSTQVAWSPDGRTLATDCDDHLVRLWEVDSGNPAAPPLAGHTTGGTCPVFSGDGAYLFTNDWSASLKVWDLTTGSQILTTPVGGWSFSVGGRHTFVDLPGGRLARMYRFIAPKELQTIRPTGRFAPRDRYCGAHFSPDGCLLFLTSYNRLSIVRAVGGEELATISLPLTKVVAFEAATAFLTSGPQVLVRWPTRAEAGDRVLRIGPPGGARPEGRSRRAPFGRPRGPRRRLPVPGPRHPPPSARTAGHHRRPRGHAKRRRQPRRALAGRRKS